MLTRVYDGATRLLDRITLGGPFRMSGPDDFDREPSPAAISGTGEVELRISARYPGNAAPSVFIYGTTLPIVP